MRAANTPPTHRPTTQNPQMFVIPVLLLLCNFLLCCWDLFWLPSVQLFFWMMRIATEMAMRLCEGKGGWNQTNISPGICRLRVLPQDLWARTVRCARAVRKVGHFGPVSPDGQGNCGKPCVPIHRTAHIRTQTKNSDGE